VSPENSSEPALDHVISPCIGICAVDDNGQCLGCFRTLDEIASWPTLSREQQSKLLEELPKRGFGHD